jgi:hypothetical protein
VCNAGILLTLAAVGAALVHVVSYHLPGGIDSGRYWTATLPALLVHCPLLGPLGVLVAIAVFAPLYALREIVRLERLAEALSRRLAAHGYADPPHELMPRSPWRLIAFVAALLILQILLLSLAQLLCPMPATMVMGGVVMTMPAAPAVLLTPLHLLVAFLLGALLWSTERRLTCLRTGVAHRLRLLAAMPGIAAATPPLPGRPQLPPEWWARALLARPPPIAA